jgi:hypothetical protein
MDIYMAEPYGADFSGITHAMGVFGTMAARPVWLAQDAPDANLIVPKAYFAITQGATGILYFTWSDFQADSTKLAAAQQAFTELGSLQDVVFAPSDDSEVTATAGISTLARSARGKRYILAVNPTAQTVAADFTVASLPAGAAVNVLFENRTLTSTSGGFSDSFAGVARHVYELP